MRFTIAYGVAKLLLLRTLIVVGSALSLDTILSQLHPHNDGTWQSIGQMLASYLDVFGFRSWRGDLMIPRVFVVFFCSTQVCVRIVSLYLLSCLCQLLSTNRRAMWCEIRNCRCLLMLSSRLIIGHPRRNEFLR
jgi:hypothetical protein